MELFDFSKLTNNQNNLLNLPYIKYNDIIHDNISRFKDFDKINIDDGLYFLDNHWQYILIKNGYLIFRVEFDNYFDLLPNIIWINEIDNYELVIRHYYYSPLFDLEKKLICTIPFGLSVKAYNFIDILFFSGYTIEEPYEFDVIKDTLGNDTIILKRGKIIKYQE